MAFVALFAARGVLLRGFAVLLVVDQSGETADAVFLGNGDGKYEDAARMYHAGEVRRVLVRVGPSERVVALKLLPDRATTGRDRLTRLGVPADAVTAFGHPDHDAWDATRRLGEWMREHPDAVVIVACERYQAWRWRVAADQLLGADAARVRVRPLPYRRFGDEDWWTSDEGRREVFVQAVRLAYAAVVGERPAPWQDWNPDAYEARLR